jgi:two-component system CheB/CheR fusion protein
MAGRKPGSGADDSSSVPPDDAAADAGRHEGGPADAGPDRPLAIVGIGASAGGLEALKLFLTALEPESGLAFVLIPHLDPAHKSMMAQLLGRYTRMPVSEASDGERIVANRVYVIPPNRDLHIDGGLLHLTTPTDRHRATTPIDACLRSLARDQGERAIGIILSGTGSHGVLGVRELKVAGGLVMAQDPKTAQYDAMPRNAIATGLVDYVLAPDAMPAALLRYVRHPYLHDESAGPQQDESTEFLKRILALLRARTKYDFRSYRKNMVARRIQRRMGLAHMTSEKDYLARLRDHPDEVTALCKDLLIGVTAFFREPAAFDVLQQRVLPELVRGRNSDTPLRVWVPGCATGEEVYSIGMLLIEAFTAQNKAVNLQIFATDIDEDSLEVGRLGCYPENIDSDVSPERLQRFFVRQNDGRYQVSEQLREVVIFAPQNLIGDAPFSRLDLVSCRNVLIYLDPDVQRKVVTLFHFALREGGYLLLGPSETIGPHVDMFEPVSKKWRVYRRIGPARRDLVEIPIADADERLRLRPHTAEPAASTARHAELTQRLLLETFAPAAVLINLRYEILYFYGPTGLYLEQPTGAPTRDLVLMARSGLRTRLRAACHRAIRDGEVVEDVEARVKRNGEYVPCTITVQPIHEPREAHGLLLIVFQDRARVGPSRELRTEDDEPALVRQLEHELRVTSEDLRSTIEELESSNEELKASNEEVMSMNEELQSTNEELETSKEELQSLNEELSTVNSQQQEKVEELELASNDMTNLLNSTDIAAVFLDRQLRIKRFTSPVASLYRLLRVDIGRPFEDFAPRFINDDVLSDCRRVLERLTPMEREVRSVDGQHYLRRILPYRTFDSRIEGVVITLIDIGERVRAEARERLLASVLENSSDAIIIQDLDGRITAWNRGAAQLYGYSADEALTLNVRALVPEGARTDLESVLQRAAAGEAVAAYATRRVRSDGQTIPVAVATTTLRDDVGRPTAIATTERDVTQIRLAASRLQEIERLRRMVEHLPAAAVFIVDDRLEQNQAAQRITGYARDELQTLDAWFGTLFGEDGISVRAAFRADFESGYPGTRTVTMTRRDGEPRTVEFAGYAFEESQVWVLQDVTDRQRAEAALRASEARQRAILETAQDAIVTFDEAGAIQTINAGAERQFGYPRADAAGRRIGLLVPALQLEPDGFAVHADRKAGQGPGGMQVLARHRDGSAIPVELLLTEVVEPDGRFYTAIIRDISVRRDLEATLAHIALDERYRIARELHDGLGSQLAGVSMLTEALRRQVEHNEQPELKKVAELAETIQKSREELRRIAHGLLPLELDEHGLEGALEELADQVRSTHGIACQCTFDDDLRIEDTAAAAQLFRIAQEAVNNAVQHARPSHIGIFVSALAEGVELRVEDDGSGMAADRPETGRGIAIMKERARLLNATLDIRTRAGGGTVVTCTCQSVRGPGEAAS